MNVHDYLKSLSPEEIKENYCDHSHNAAFAMTHLSGDFNLGNVIRSANFFGFKEAIYVGGSKSYDRRSTVGTHHYIPISFIRTEEEFISTINGKYSLVCIENNIQLHIIDGRVYKNNKLKIHIMDIIKLYGLLK